MKKTLSWILCVAALLALLSGCLNDPGEKLPQTDWWAEQQLPQPITDLSQNLTKSGGIRPMLKKGIPVVKVLDAPSDGSADVTAALREAINYASANFNGGIVYIPAGRYRLEGSVTVKSNVTLMGEWTQPEADTDKSALTVFEIYDREGLGYTLGGASGTFNLVGNAGLSDITFYYPNQGKGGIKSYPATISNDGSYMQVWMENLTLVNAYSGIEINGLNGSIYRNVYMTALNNGMYLNGLREIPVVENIKIRPEFWHYFDNSYPVDAIKNLTKTNSVGITLGLIDWIYAYNFELDSLKTGIAFADGTHNGATFSTNGQFDKISITNASSCMTVNGSNGVGNTFSRSRFEAAGQNAAVVNYDGTGMPSAGMPLMFSGCTFKSDGSILKNVNNHSNMFSFTNCTFSDWGAGTAAFDLKNNVMLQNSNTFAAAKGNQISASGQLSQAMLYANTYTSALEVTGEGRTRVQSAAASAGVDSAAIGDSLAEIEQSAHRLPSAEKLFWASDFGAVSEEAYSVFEQQDAQIADSSEALQHALNAAAAAGGGYVMLDKGYYSVNRPLVVPQGVELCGVTVSAKHFGASARGSVLVTDYGKNDKDAQALITLGKNAGLSGFSVFYSGQTAALPDQTNVTFDNYSEYALTVSMPKDGAYLDAMTFVNSYRAVKATGDDILISRTRGMGLDYFVLLEGADRARIDYLLGTGGDWQDCYGLASSHVPSNIPPANWWQQFPNYVNATGLRIADSDDVVLFQSFVFGFGTGLELTGEVNGLMSYGFGVDSSSYGIKLSNSGQGNVFSGNELVSGKYPVWATASHTGSVQFFLTNAWLTPAYLQDVLIENGNVLIQGYKNSVGGIRVTGGRVSLQDVFLTANRNSSGGSSQNLIHLTVTDSPRLESVTVVNFVAGTSNLAPRIENNAGSKLKLINVKT